MLSALLSKSSLNVYKYSQILFFSMYSPAWSARVSDVGIPNTKVLSPDSGYRYCYVQKNKYKGVYT